MEDAVSLATCLGVAGKTDVPWATRVHNKLRLVPILLRKILLNLSCTSDTLCHRFERVSCLQLLGVLNHEMRNRSANADVSQTKPIGILSSWIWKHDPERYVIQNYEKAKAHLTSGSEFANTNIPRGHVYRPWTIDMVLKAKEKGENALDGEWDD